ncbi:hypothetical protein C9J60_23750 [Streptomyces sp. A244]|nr:hypothetical protein C9J60_23750 [Streptomyces sp. A244]
MPDRAASRRGSRRTAQPAGRQDPADPGGVARREFAAAYDVVLLTGTAPSWEKPFIVDQAQCAGRSERGEHTGNREGQGARRVNPIAAPELLGARSGPLTVRPTSWRTPRHPSSSTATCPQAPAMSASTKVVSCTPSPCGRTSTAESAVSRSPAVSHHVGHPVSLAPSAMTEGRQG